MALNPKASTYHKDVALNFLLHTMPMEIRHRFVAEHPAAYNDVIGLPETFVTVRKTDNQQFPAL